MVKTRNAVKPLSFISLIPLWLSPVNRPAPLPTRESEKDESDPPKKVGGRYRPHLSLREGSQQPPTSWSFQGVDAALGS